MGRGDDEQEWKQAQGARDTELTLGGGLLLLIGCGLILLCGVCFGLGYAVGHRGAAETAASVAPAASRNPQPSRGVLQPSRWRRDNLRCPRLRPSSHPPGWMIRRPRQARAQRQLRRL